MFFKQTEGYVQKNVDEEGPMLLNHLHAKQRPPVLTNLHNKLQTCMFALASTQSFKMLLFLPEQRSLGKCISASIFLSLVFGLACVFG